MQFSHFQASVRSNNDGGEYGGRPTTNYIGRTRDTSFMSRRPTGVGLDNIPLHQLVQQQHLQHGNSSTHSLLVPQPPTTPVASSTGGNGNGVQPFLVPSVAAVIPPSVTEAEESCQEEDEDPGSNMDD
jgi:hypothetical protein